MVLVAGKWWILCVKALNKVVIVQLIFGKICKKSYKRLDFVV